MPPTTTPPPTGADVLRPLLVASDLDGTLLRSDGTLSDRTRRAVAAVEATGVVVVFVTARPPRWLHGLADAVGGHGLAICANGAFLYDVHAREVVEQHPMDTALARTLIDDLRVAVPGIGFAVERASGMVHEAAFDTLGEDDTVEERPDAYDLLDEPVGKLLARGRDDAAGLIARVRDVVADRAELAFSGAVGLAEMTAPGVTKAAALARWCEAHEVPSARTWAFGDMPNDLPMLHWAGRAHAVGNAHPDVVAVAHETLPTHDDDGVAVALERLLAPGTHDDHHPTDPRGDL